MFASLHSADKFPNEQQIFEFLLFIKFTFQSFLPLPVSRLFDKDLKLLAERPHLFLHLEQPPIPIVFAQLTRVDVIQLLFLISIRLLMLT